VSGSTATLLPEVAVQGARILIVDDEEPIRRALQRLLVREGFECGTASSAAEARALLRSEPFALMLCDVMMPDESGFSLLAHVHVAHPEMAVIMVTAVNDRAAAEPAAQGGAYAYIVKPFDPNMIIINVVGALERAAHTRAELCLRAELENEVARNALELNNAVRRLAAGDSALMAAQEETVIRLALAAEWRDPCTGVHLQRMSAHTAHLAELHGVAPDDVEYLRIASQMHDLGKISIPDAILLKAGPLTTDERVVMQGHARAGYDMLLGSDSPLLAIGAIVALTHHEWFDGTGYPQGLVGDAIPLAGRIVAIADVYDALQSERPYKRAFSKAESLEILTEGRGTHFDPELLDLFMADIGAA
jgi:putative two-component system response regulator